MKKLFVLFVIGIVSGCEGKTENLVRQINKSGVDSTVLEKNFQNDKIWIDPNLDTINFESGTFLYWQVNSDSAWMTFETLDGKKFIVNTDYLGYWDRLGTLYRKEYDNYIFFIHRWISGCCTNPDFILIDKYTGKELKRVKSENGIYADEEENFLLYFKDSTMNEMIYFDLEQDHSYRFDVEKFKLLETAKEFKIVNSAEFFMFIDYPKFRENEVSILIEHLPKNEKGEFKRDSIIFEKVGL